MWAECWPVVERFLIATQFFTRDDAGRFRYLDYPALRQRLDVEGVPMTQTEWRELGAMADHARRVVNEHVNRKLEANRA